jgi:hypothetical protein
LYGEEGVGGEVGGLPQRSGSTFASAGEEVETVFDVNIGPGWEKSGDLDPLLAELSDLLLEETVLFGGP